jgi:hypothetical protein
MDSFFLAPRLQISCKLLIENGMLDIHVCSEYLAYISPDNLFISSRHSKQAIKLIVNSNAKPNLISLTQ